MLKRRTVDNSWINNEYLVRLEAIFSYQAKVKSECLGNLIFYNCFSFAEKKTPLNDLFLNDYIVIIIIYF